MPHKILLLALAAIGILNAEVIATSQPAEPITAARIAQLPASERAAWTAYLDRSQRQMQADRAALAAERTAKSPIPPLPKSAYSASTVPLDRDATWYSSGEARHIADVIVSFQTPAGGWSKNLDLSGSPRLPGQSYAPDNLNKHPGPADFDAPHNPDWNYVGTLDNDSTTTELYFLARVAAAASPADAERYRTSVLKGIRYLLDAQFPNGGWPQIWPLQGGYHDAITFNDNAVTHAAELMTAVSSGAAPFSFVPTALRNQAAVSAARALDCILRTQIRVNGKLTAWAQQHDALTLEPAAARNYEPAALSSGESSALLLYLMSLPNPSPAVIASVDAGVAWLRSIAIYGQAWVGDRSDPAGRHLEPRSGAGPIWSRFYSVTTNRPIFGDRDKTIHDNVAEISLERRNGYSWFSSALQHALDVYAAWHKQHPSPRASNP
jgi:PelA/Pel-15E family pectate lyase